MQRLRGLKNILLSGVFVFGLAAVSFAAQEPGKVEIIASKGKVISTDGSGKATSLKKGSVITEGTQITTGSGSSATLLFANGSTVILNPDSVFSVDRFTVEPFDPATVKYQDLKTEPSTSTTKVTIRKGSLAGNMRKLRPESKFEFMTPVGPAGIRGTKVFISVVPDPANPGSFIVTVASTEGTVVFTPPTGAPVRVGVGQYTQFRAVPQTSPAGVTTYTMVPITVANGALVAVPVADAPGPLQTQINNADTEATASIGAIPAAPFTGTVDVPGEATLGAPGGAVQGTSGFGTGGSGGGTGAVGNQVGGDQGTSNLGELSPSS